MKGIKNRPCETCPFLKSQAFLGAGARRLTENATSWDGDAFWCHKTVNYSNEPPSTENAQHCAGSAILGEKHGVVTQCLRIAGRLGLYRPDDLAGHELVYDSAEEMIDGHMADRNTRSREEASGKCAEGSSSEREKDTGP